MLKNKARPHSDQWRPSAAIETLRARAKLLQKIRCFFDARGVMEVETPLLCHTSVTDPYIQSIPALLQHYANQTLSPYYLQTSPEYAMKRLLAANSGPIYQLSKAFRQEEIGRYHNPEFTMLEWYRPGFNHLDLMDEVDVLLQETVGTLPAQRLSYAECFQQVLAINPHTASLAELSACAIDQNLSIQGELLHSDDWLQLLMSHCIEPQLGQTRPCFIYDFPASQAALSKIQATHPPVASRFEVYYQGIELANGFHELQDSAEQRKRFQQNVALRQSLNLPKIEIDEHLLSALAHGLPDCSGVALGIDRLVMLALTLPSIQDVLAFDIARA